MPQSCRHTVPAFAMETHFTVAAETVHTFCMFQMNNYVKLH